MTNMNIPFYPHEVMTKAGLKDYGKRWSGSNRSIIVFADHDRPFDKGDLAGDFAWRRQHQAPYSPKELLEKLTEKFAGTGIEVVSAKYSRKAGCSTCPCSPGYIVAIKGSYGGPRRAIWL